MDAAADFADALTRKFPDYGTFTVARGKVYDKIICESPGQTYVHAFVSRATHGLIKAATWKAPQKNVDGTPAVRFDLSTPSGFNAAVEAADKYGAYLYKR